MADNDNSFDISSLATPQGILGMLSRYTPQVMQSNSDTSKLIDQQMGALSSMRNVDPELAFYAALGAPTKTGSMGESISGAGGAYFGALNQQRTAEMEKMQKMLALQQAKQQLAMTPITMATQIAPLARQAGMASLYSNAYGSPQGGAPAGGGSPAGGVPQAQAGSAPSPDAQPQDGQSAAAPQGGGVSAQAPQGGAWGTADLAQAKRDNALKIELGRRLAMTYGDNSVLKEAQEEQLKLMALDPALAGAKAGAEKGAQYPYELGLKSFELNPDLKGRIANAEEAGKQAANPTMITVRNPDGTTSDITKDEYLRRQRDAVAAQQGAGGQGGSGSGPVTGLTPEKQKELEANIGRDAEIGKQFDQDSFKFQQNASSQENEINKIASLYKEYQPGRWAEQKADLIGKAVSLGIIPANSAAGIQQADFDTALKLSMDQALKKQQDSGGSRAPASFLNAAQKTVGGPTVAPGAARDVLALTLANHNYLKDLYAGYDNKNKPNVNDYMTQFGQSHDPQKYLQDAYDKIGVFKGMDIPAPQQRVHGVQYPTPQGVLYWDASRNLWTNTKPAAQKTSE